MVSARDSHDERQAAAAPLPLAAPIPFTPPTASVNRVQIVDLPGVAMDDAVRGQKAYHLLSALAVARHVLEHAEALRVPAAYRRASAEAPELRRALPRHLDASLGSEDAGVRAAAETIARRLGRNLGHILLALHRGDAVNRRARGDWTDAAWAQWHTIRRVWIGGGLVSGALGERIVEHARAFLAETGYGERIAVSRTPRPRDMPLLGAARYLPGAARRALCLDFGSTSVKRALVHLRGGALAHAQRLPERAVPWRWRNDPTAAEDIDGATVVDFVADTVAESVKAVGPEALSPALVFSVAAYVRGGELLGNGIYARMMRLADDARRLLAEAIEERAGLRMAPHPIHDGTAAAALHAGAPDAAVLVIGTAIGVGFPPAKAEGLRRLAGDFAFKKRRQQIEPLDFDLREV